MATKDALHRLVDELADEELAGAQRLLEYLQAAREDPFRHSLLTAPEENEDLSSEEAAALATARARRAGGETHYTSSAELKREIGW